MKRSAIEYRRCRPHLGTFVEVSLLGGDLSTAAMATQAAFQAISRVERAMSFHDPKSELSRLNQARPGKWKRVRPPLLEVLRLALELEKKTNGRFSVSIADPLISWKYLPGKTSRNGFENRRPTFQIKGNRVCRLTPARIDLGGIAKGFAVDRAVEAILKCHPGFSGIVNAGGDLRVFGSLSRMILVRSGDRTRSRFRKVSLRNEALATSTVHPRYLGRQKVSPYIDRLRKRPLVKELTAVSRSRHCVLADAMTKVALLSPFYEARKVAQSLSVELSVFR